MTLKQVVQKLVPYSSAVYAEHVFRQMSVAGNAKATTEEGDGHISILIQAAERLRDLVKDLNDASKIKGYVVYRAESEEDKRKKQEEEERLKALIKQNQADAAEHLQQDGGDQEDEAVTEEVAEIIQKFKGKILKEFMPNFLLQQYNGEDNDDLHMEYESFDQAVDEYFS